MEAIAISNSSEIDIVATFFLNDIPGASVPASRLRGILERVNARRALTVLQQEFLRQHSLDALLLFALGELDMEALRLRARAEQVRRLKINAAAKDMIATEKALKAEISNRKNAALFAEREKQLERRRVVRELPDRFDLPYIDREDLRRVNQILRSVTDGHPIEKNDLVWFGAGGKEYWTDELRKAHHGNLAKKLSDEWAQTKDVWKAINACGHWRKAECSEEGLVIAEAALDQAAMTKKTHAALLTTGGGALRDLRRLQDSARFGKEAHSLTPKDFRPCTLLGAVNIEMRAYGTGAEWYEKAEALGASRNVIDRELQSILNAAPQEERNQIKNALKARNGLRYEGL